MILIPKRLAFPASISRRGRDLSTAVTRPLVAHTHRDMRRLAAWRRRQVNNVAVGTRIQQPYGQSGRFVLDQNLSGFYQLVFKWQASQ
jgi:hypothetical protein